MTEILVGQASCLSYADLYSLGDIRVLNLVEQTYTNSVLKSYKWWVRHYKSNFGKIKDGAFSVLKVWSEG